MSPVSGDLEEILSGERSRRGEARDQNVVE
jgi:hypothetical protein